MMKNILVLFILFFSINLYAQDKDSLDVVKTELEIVKLNKEINHSNLLDYAQAITVLIGVLGLFWTINSGIRDSRARLKEQRLNKITSHLENLFSEDAKKKVTAALLISKYVDDVIDECLSLLSLEDNLKVKNSLQKALVKSSIKFFDIFIESNNSSLIELSELIGYFEKEGNNNNEIVKILNIPLYKLEFIKDNFRFHIINSKNSSSVISENQSSFILKSARNLIESTSKVISNKIINNNKKIVLRNLELNHSQWYALSLKNKEFFGTLLDNVRGNHSNLINVIIKNCYLFNSSFIDAAFKGTGFIDTLINNCKLIDLQINGSKFDNCEIISSDLSKAKFSNITFSNIIFDNCNLNGISILKKTKIVAKSNNATNSELVLDTINKNKFGNCKIVGAKFYKTEFNITEFNGGELNHSDFYKCIFNNIEFNGTKLISVKFTGCVFNNCKFSGNELKGLELIEPKFDNTKFYKCLNIDKIKIGKNYLNGLISSENVS